jgi:hypothetical protein
MPSKAKPAKIHLDEEEKRLEEILFGKPSFVSDPELDELQTHAQVDSEEPIQPVPSMDQLFFVDTSADAALSENKQDSGKPAGSYERQFFLVSHLLLLNRSK